MFLIIDYLCYKVFQFCTSVIQLSLFVTGQLADQPRESLTFFPEYVEMDSTAAAKDLGNDPQKLSSCNANGDSSKHVSVIKVV